MSTLLKNLDRYLADSLSRDKKKDSLFQRRRALSRMTDAEVHPASLGTECYQLDERRFCQLITSEGFHDALKAAGSQGETRKVIQQYVARHLKEQRLHQARELYRESNPHLKHPDDSGELIAGAFLALADSPAYDADHAHELNADTFYHLMLATYSLREVMPCEALPVTNMVNLWFFLGMWHQTPVTTNMMARAVTEMEEAVSPNWYHQEIDFGRTNDVGSDNWGDEGTPCYWNGDRFLTPFAARQADALIDSQTQDAGSFSRDAMCDARAVAGLFQVNLATAVF
ncbi:hypothetical protein [Cobetia marina]|uniref:hypothetical protein n=1 Tax=Cobetia marina TaxID=28258 RepID=UPI001143FEC8|nr:hypothetical protein [Cobetia marina]GED41221.1 hypothetical protein HHA02_05500 [Cobetia marina]